MWDLDMIQNIPDPLGHIIDLASVKKEDLFMVVRFLLHCKIKIQLYSCVKRFEASCNAIHVDAG